MTEQTGEKTETDETIDTRIFLCFGKVIKEAFPSFPSFVFWEIFHIQRSTVWGHFT
jgi:hypothetical protein